MSLIQRGTCRPAASYTASAGTRLRSLPDTPGIPRRSGCNSSTTASQLRGASACSTRPPRANSRSCVSPCVCCRDRLCRVEHRQRQNQDGSSAAGGCAGCAAAPRLGLPGGAPAVAGAVPRAGRAGAAAGGCGAASACSARKALRGTIASAKSGAPPELPIICNCGPGFDKALALQKPLNSEAGTADRRPSATASYNDTRRNAAVPACYQRPVAGPRRALGGGGGSRGKTRLRGGRQPAPRAYPPFLTSHGLFSTSLSCGQHSSATLWGRSHRPPVNCVSLHAPLQLRLHLRRLPSPASASGAHATRQPPMHTLDARRAHLPSVYCTGMRPARAGRDPPKTDQ